MGKKIKGTGKAIRKFRKNNKVMLAAFSGAAAGIVIAGMFGTEKARELLDGIENGIKEFSNKIADSQHQPGTT